jgi:hypothetical protein
MTELELAVRELERLQGIIARHEGHIFTLRGWLVTAIGALIAAYYSENLGDLVVLRVALPLVAALFVVMELRHVNLIEAVVDRAMDIENRIAARRLEGWYEGPRVSATCLEGATRWWPRRGMTLLFYQPVYLAVFLIIIAAIVWLPPRETFASQQQVPPTTGQPQAGK